MPEIAHGFSKHLEGESFYTLARIVGGVEQALLTPDDVTSLTIRVKSSGRLGYTTTITDQGGFGILSTPTKPTGWMKKGKINFQYQWNPSLSTASPPFTFQGGRSYDIEYSFLTAPYGTIVVIHTVAIEPV